MNTKNNLRFQATEELIKENFIKLLREKEINKISISELCKMCSINRTTFYLHYTDIYDLMEKLDQEMSEKMVSLFTEKASSIGDGFVKLFYYILEHRDFYYGCFRDNTRPGIIRIALPDAVKNSVKSVSSRMGYGTEKELLYHQEFFKAGITALIHLWLFSGCEETPEEMAEIINREYNPNKNPFSQSP